MADERSILDEVLERQKREGSEIQAKKNRPKASKKKSPLDALPLKKQRYIKAKIENGGNAYQAALAAGYSTNMAKHATSGIETPDVKEAFKHAVRQEIPISKIVGTVKEGLDATKTIFTSLDGKFTDSREVPDHTERRKHAALAAQMSDVWNPKQTEEQIHSLSPHTHLRILEMYEKLGLNQMSPEQLAELSGSKPVITIDAGTPEETK